MTFLTAYGNMYVLTNTKMSKEKIPKIPETADELINRIDSDTSDVEVPDSPAEITAGIERQKLLELGVPARLAVKVEKRSRKVAKAIAEAAERGEIAFTPKVTTLMKVITGSRANHHPTEYRRAAQILDQQGLGFEVFQIYDEKTEAPRDLVVITKKDDEPLVESDELIESLRPKTTQDFWQNGGQTDLKHWHRPSKP